MGRPHHLVLAVLCAAPTVATAQPAEVTIADEPTGGLDLGPNGISGSQNALSAALNPAGLHFLEGSELDLAVGLGDDGRATAGGPGFGLYYGGAIGGGLLPRIGQGLSLELVRSSRERLSPDPGTPARFTWANSLPLGRSAALGIAWHHFFDSGPLGGLDTFDLGLGLRFGAHLATGFVVRDLTGPSVAGERIEQRYELELSGRPTGGDLLEVSLGGRVGQLDTDWDTGADVDGWARLSLRVVRGVWLRGQLESRSLFVTTADPAGPMTRSERELRLGAGLEVSFGGVGAASYASSTFDDEGGRLVGGTVVARLSSKDLPAVQGRRERIQRIDLAGSLGERELTELALRLRRLARDPGLVALVLQLDGLEAGWAELGEVRRELLNLRRSGKKVYSYLVAGTTRQYYLASASDRIFVDPAGGLRLHGFSSESIYFKGLFDKLGVVAQFEKIEEFKSAPEAYTRAGPTEAAFTMRNELHDSMYEHLIAGIAHGRRIARERVRVLIDNGPYTSGELALIPDLVDGVVTPDGLGRRIARELGGHFPVLDAPDERRPAWDSPAIAVIYIDGDIVGGKSQVIPLLGTRLVGGDTIAEAVARAAGDPSIDAIVLRINSPGGSALASELMAREVFAARARKPVICSLGDVAASGGYFAAAGCETIFADPMTITGSIGIFNGKFDVSGLLATLGLTWSTFKRGTHADTDSFFRAYTEAERAMLKRKLHYYYGRFIQTVARGRRMTTEKVNEVGRGHVWTGLQAMPIGLVDRHGGIADAVTLAKQRIGVAEDAHVRIVSLPSVPTSLLGRLVGPISGAAEAPARGGLLEVLFPGAAATELGAAFPGSLWAEPGVPQARLPFALITSD